MNPDCFYAYEDPMLNLAVASLAWKGFLKCAPNKIASGCVGALILTPTYNCDPNQVDNRILREILV